MSIDKSEQRDELLNTVRDALRRAERYCAGTRRSDTLLSLISIICGAVATVLAGGTVIGGQPALGRCWPMADSLFDGCTVDGIRHRCWRPPQKLSDYDSSFERGEVRRTA